MHDNLYLIHNIDNPKGMVRGDAKIIIKIIILDDSMYYCQSQYTIFKFYFYLFHCFVIQICIYLFYFVFIATFLDD